MPGAAGPCDVIFEWLQSPDAHSNILFSRLWRESQMQYNPPMKTATIPPVRVEPSFRQEMERSLETNESLASLVETAVRNEVMRRQVQTEFMRRGLASIQSTIAAGDGIPAQSVIDKLEAKLAAAKRRA